MRILDHRKIFLLCIVSFVSLVRSAKRQNCSQSDEAAEFQKQYFFDDTCTSVCVRNCGEDVPSPCLEMVSLDGTCGTYATCGTNGCECLPFEDIQTVVTSTNFAVEPSVECSANYVTFRFSKCPANAYGLYLKDMFMDGPGTSDGTTLATDAHNTCKGKIVYCSNSLMYEFTITNYNACNTLIEETSDQITWKNAVIGLTAPPAIPSNVSRSRSMHLNFSCQFTKQLEYSLGGAFNPVIGETRGTLIPGNGAVSLTMGLWSDDTYSTPFSSGDSIEVLSFVYVGISSATFVVGQNFVIIASHVTPSPNRDNATRFDLISDSCPVDDLTTITKTGVDNEVRYKFAAFTFASLPQAGQSIWVHATVKVCAPSGTCPKSCPTRKRRSAVQDEGLSILVGPITITKKGRDPPSSISNENAQEKSREFVPGERILKEWIRTRPQFFNLFPVCLGLVFLLVGSVIIIAFCMHCCFINSMLFKIKSIPFFTKKRELTL